MSTASPLRALFPLLTGLLIGGAGVYLFRQSQPAEEGSVQEKVEQLQYKVDTLTNKLMAAEARGGRRPGDTLGDGFRSLVEDIRDGRPVSPDDIFHRAQPLLRDLAPLFERMRIRESERRMDSLTGEFSRKYELNPAQQLALREWFRKKSEQDAKDWSDMVGSGTTTFAQLMKASQDPRPDDGLDAFMEGTLSGSKLADFKTERMAQRTDRVQQIADMKTQRLDSIVQLDDSQRDQVFGIMARGSSDYDPGMTFQGADGQPIGGSGAGMDAALEVLRPEQRQAYEAAREERRQSAERDLQAVGLVLPPDWDLLDP